MGRGERGERREEEQNAKYWLNSVKITLGPVVAAREGGRPHPPTISY